MTQAIQGLEGNSGDCYTHAVACKVLLERAGYICVMIEQMNETGTHYWIMVNLDGVWYHMDPSPIYITQYVPFLATTEQLYKWAERWRPHLYDYTEEDYPTASATSPVDVVYKDGDYQLTMVGEEETPVVAEAR